VNHEQAPGAGSSAAGGPAAARADHEVDVAVVGAGIGGLTVALSLHRLGIHAEVFERTTELREVGAAVALSANGTRILDRLGVTGDLEPRATVPTELIFRHWSSGSRIAAFPIGQNYRDRFGGPFWGIHRAYLQHALAAGWTKVGPLHVGHEVVGLHEDPDGVLLDFATGSRVRARLVVGADGVHSVVRRKVDETAPVYSGTSGFRGLVPVSDLPTLPDPSAVQFWPGPDAHLLHYQVDDRINFLAVLEGPKRWDTPEWTALAPAGQLARRFADWHPAVVEMVTAVTQSPQWALLALPALRRWSAGRVVLLGDAAHTMLPHHGQGANQTIEDAAVLAGCLADVGLDGYGAALLRYERRRRPRTRLVQHSSRIASDMLHLPDDECAEQRNRRLIDLDNQVAWIHAHDATSEAAQPRPVRSRFHDRPTARTRT
jgi:salicylate hydroxylase